MIGLPGFGFAFPYGWEEYHPHRFLEHVLQQLSADGCPLCREKHPAQFHCFAGRSFKRKRKEEESEEGIVVTQVPRIFCDINYHKRLETSELKQSTPPTPIGGGIRSLNVALRRILDLYACVRPVRWIRGVPSPVVHPEQVDMVIFRENTEDVYAGLEFEEGSAEAAKLIEYCKKEFGWQILPDSGVGLKPISITRSQRLVRAAINYALENNRKSVTLVHKGNIQKYTEGAFMKWGYELAKKEFSERCVAWEDIDGKVPEGKILIKDVIADIFLQQILTRPTEFDVIATTNLNGDYASDALAAQVGGIGIAPGGNINYLSGHAVFEATHGTAPKYANQDKVNPGSLILSGEMMLRYMGWAEAADLIIKGLEKTIANKTVTYDFARLTEGAKLLKCSEFGSEIIANM